MIDEKSLWTDCLTGTGATKQDNISIIALNLVVYSCNEIILPRMYLVAFTTKTTYIFLTICRVFVQFGDSIKYSMMKINKGKRLWNESNENPNGKRI